MNKIPSLRCAIYTRKSSEEGLEQEFNSLHAQREACEAYIKSQAHEGWKLLTTLYDDGGFSGGCLERPALQNLLSDIAKGKIDVVVVYKVDRLTRSLTDFAKIVEIFETNKVSFVSITQSFNTTTSMGRLTLNVLLSFAQFEREVIGERIRDKIAASKQKGIWMGGIPPLGYDVRERKLVANPAEAKQVGVIFERYLELRSVPELVFDLRKRGIQTKTWKTGTGVERKGRFFERGALYALLRNPVYLGKIAHKGKVYPGEHQAILDTTLWEKAQALLSSQGGKRREAKASELKSLLSGVLYDDRGNRMVLSHATKGGRRYRYYVSQPLLKQNTDAGGSIPRVPAQVMEELVSLNTRAFLPVPVRKRWEKLSPPEQVAHLQQTLQRVELRAQEVVLRLSKDALDPRVSNLNGLSHPGLHLSVEGESLVVRIPIRLKTWGGERLIHTPRGEAQETGRPPDKALVKAVIRGLEWREALEKGEAESISDLARKSGCAYRYVKRILRLGVLAPDIVGKILQGRQPHGVNLSHILQVDLPLSWKIQREALGFFGESEA